MTARLKNLENELGTPLFHRMPKGMALTPAGKTLYSYSKRILTLLNESIVTVKNDGNHHGLSRWELLNQAPPIGFPLLWPIFIPSTPMLSCL